MPYYRLYYKAGERIRDVLDFNCHDDPAALRQACASRDGRAMELWRLDRMLWTWEADGDTAPGARAPH